MRVLAAADAFVLRLRRLKMPSSQRSLLVCCTSLTLLGVDQGDASNGEMSERLAEQALEISSLRAQLAAAPQALDDSLDYGGGMSLGESLGDAFGTPPPVGGSADPPLTSEMREKLERAEALGVENEDLRQQVGSLRQEVAALQAEVDVGADEAVNAQRIADELRDVQGRYEDGLQKVEKANRDVKRMKGFLKEAKDVIEKQQLKIRESERKAADAGLAAVNSQQVAQLKQDVARLRGARDEAEEKAREVVARTTAEVQTMTAAFYAQQERHTVELQSLKVSRQPSWLMGYQRQTLREGRSAASARPSAHAAVPPPVPTPKPEAIE